MRFTTTALLAVLLFAAPAFAQAPASQSVAPSAALKPTNPLTYTQALETVDFTPQQKATLLQAFKKRDAAIEAWYEQNKQDLTTQHEAAKSAGQANDTAALAQAQKRLAELDKQQEAIRNQLRKDIAQVLTENETKAIDSLMRTSPPPLDGSGARRITISFEKPEFTPQITLSVHNTLIDLAKSLTQPDVSLSDQQKSIEASLKKILTSFSDGEINDLVKWQEGVLWLNTPLNLTAQQVTSINNIVTSIPPQATPDPADTEKLLRHVIATLTPQQANALSFSTTKGTPFINGANPPLRPDQAIEVLSLAAEQKAQALKIIADFDITAKPVFEKTSVQLKSLYEEERIARESNDRPALDAAIKNIMKADRAYRKFYAGLGDQLSTLLTASDHKRFVTLTTVSPSPDAAPSTSPRTLSHAQAVEALALPPEKKAALLKAVTERNQQMAQWNKNHLEESSALGRLFSNIHDKDAPKPTRETIIRFAELQASRDAINADFTNAAQKLLTPDEFRKFTALTTPWLPAPRPLYSYTIRVDKPNFSPERVRAIYAAFAEMLNDPPPDKNTSVDRDLAIQKALLTTLRLFPPGQQLGLNQWYSTSGTSPYFCLTDDQAAKISHTAAQIRNQPEGVSAAVAASQALATILDTLTPSQKQLLFRQSFNGEPGDTIAFPATDGPPPPTNVRMKPRRALEALNLSPDLYARAEKALQAHIASLKESNNQIIPLTRDLLKARRAEDQTAIQDLEKRLAVLKPQQDAAIAQFEKNFKQLLTPPVYQQYLDGLDPKKSDLW